jgi:hypothetical protein
MTGRPRQRPSTCAGCGLVTLDPGGPAPAEHIASAACFAAYGQVLARSYTDPAYRRVHQMVVDAYAAQHAGGTTRRQVQTVALCLMTLCLFVEDDVEIAEGPALHKAMVARRPDFTWLAPPPRPGLLTIAEVLTAEGPAEHCRLVREWGGQVWQAWSQHHATIRAWNAQALTPWT